MMMTMDQCSERNWTNPNTLSLPVPDIDWSVFENADRYLLRDDSAWITRLSKDFWWNLERISELTITRDNPVEQIFSARKIVGQRSAIIRPNSIHIPEKFDSNQDFGYNPFQSKISFDNNIWTNYFQQAIPWQ